MAKKDIGNPKIDKTAVTIYCSIVILALALTSFNFFISDFKISVGVIFLSAFLLLIPEFPLINVTVVCAVGIAVVRSVGTSDPVKYVVHSISRYLPETTFYLVYGLLLFLAYRYLKDRMKHFPGFVITVAVIDYISNCVELLIRVQGGAFTGEYQLGIIAVAIARAILAWFIIFLFKKYLKLLAKHGEGSISTSIIENLPDLK